MQPATFSKIPVTILTGFLGSGKTTLLNALIRQHPDKKIAIIENEFGEISIDNELVIGVKDGIFEIANGCVCCSMNGELVSTLLKIINEKPDIQHLIIETTGIADPGPVALNFVTDYKIQQIFKLNAIVAMADASQIEQRLEDTEEACKQIIQADLVLVNKTDLVDSYQLSTVTNIIKRLNPQGQIKYVEHGGTSVADILDMNVFDPEVFLKSQSINPEKKGLKPNFKRLQTEHTLPDALRTIQLMSADASGRKLNHHSGITSHSFCFSDPLDILKIDAWLNSMLNGHLSKFYRVKGILNMENFDEKVVLQSVGSQFITEAGGKWEATEERLTKIVFIGLNLNKEILAEGLSQCLFNEDTMPDQHFYEKILLNQVDMFLKQSGK